MKLQCTNPLYGYIAPDDKGKSKLRTIDKRKGETPPAEYPELKLPCRKCMPCRIRHSGNWVVRLLHEASLHHYAPYFPTFTYDDENVPLSLKHRDFQLFMKRLRKKFSGNKIRFFMCGEYGETTLRPHYHAILFGLLLDDLKPYKKNSNGDQLYNSKTLTDLWGLGHVVVGYANKSSMAYTAGYLLKEQFRKGIDGSYKYERCDPDTGEIVEIQRPYIRMSTNPGIGKVWLDKYVQDTLKGFLTIEGKKQGIPEYYVRRMEKDHPEAFEQLKKLRENQAMQRLVAESEWETQTGKSWDEHQDNLSVKKEEMRQHKTAFFNTRKQKL